MEVFEDLSDDEVEFVEFIEYERRPYVIRPRKNPFDEFDDLDFFFRFRLKKETVLMLLQLIEHMIETPTDRNHSISPINKILLTLRFYASGNFLISVGDFLQISKSATCNIIKNVSNAIASLAPQFIKMPSNEIEMNQRQMEFYQIARLPRTIGSLDCTHIRIQSPGGNQAEVFRNRKGFFSINVQTVSSANLKIQDIVARWPGSAHDQIVFDNSSINHRLHNNEFGNRLLVADSGYANTMHVITPLLLNQYTEVEQLYNESVRRTRNPVERQYGIWKRRFPVLSVGIRLKLPTTQTVIVACAVLHNIAIEQNEEMPPNDPELIAEVNDFEDDLDPQFEENVNITAREYLVNKYFMRLNVE